jgi:hypothetical protein
MVSRIVAFVVVILSLSTTIAFAGDSLVIVGAGYAPPWDTDFVLANREQQESEIWVGPSRTPLSHCLSCPGVTVVLPPDGTGKTTALTMLAAYASFVGVTTAYVVPHGSSLPTVTARVVNRARPGQSIELPVVRYSTIEALNPAVLSFPAATRSPDSHSNLFVAEVSREQGRGLSVLVEAYSSAGDRLGSTAFVLSNGTTLFLVDVLAKLGVASLDGGQIRVIKNGGSGLMWGLLTTVSNEGRVSVSPGVNP